MNISDAFFGYDTYVDADAIVTDPQEWRRLGITYESILATCHPECDGQAMIGR
ncbi:hypothetical protein [Streptomyces sp. NPDC048191]|uniref:hypothetical protein n=1 Tax=Streptomyces sp. NPDC048191 TaxID=3155484 RepID=UPI0033C279E5